MTTVRTRSLFCFLLVGLCLSSLAHAVPEYDGEFFTDFTHRVTGRKKTEVSRVLRLSAETSLVHPMLVVVDRLADYPDMPQDIQQFATRLANEWRIGESTSKKGLLALFAIQDRAFFIARTDNVEQSVLDRIRAAIGGRTTDALRRGDVPTAMLLAAENIATALPPSAAPTTVTTRTVTRTRREVRSSGGPLFSGHVSDGGSVVAAFFFLSIVLCVFLLPFAVGISIISFFVRLLGSAARPPVACQRTPAPQGSGCSSLIAGLLIVVFLFYSGIAQAIGGLFVLGVFLLLVLCAIFGGHHHHHYHSGGGGWTSWSETTKESSSSSSSSFDSFGGGSFNGGGSGGSW